MGFLQKLLEGAKAQLNRNDGGKTFSTVMRAQPAPRPQPAQTPAPQNMNFAGSLSYGKPNAIGPAQTPSKATKVLKPVVPQVDIKNRYAQINSPSYGSGLSGILNKAKDVVDANTPQDQFKRNQTLSPVAPPNQTYQQQQATNPSNLTKASNFTSSVARTVGAPMVANVDLARAGVAQVTGNQTARNNALNSAKNNTLKIPNIAKDLAVGTIESSKQVGRGLANASGTTNNAQNAQSLLNDQLAQQRITAINRAKQGFNSQQDINRFTNYADNLWGNSAESTQTQVEAQKEIQKQVDPIRNALAIADVGLTATSFGVAGATKAGASKVTANALEQNLAKNMAKDSALKAAQTAGRNEIIRQSGLTGSMGAFQGAISPYIVKDPGTVTTKDVLGGGATGAILGGVLPGAFVGASKFADPISKATNNVFKNSLNQGGYVQAGPTPKNIHFEDHGTMGDTIDMVNGKYNPTAQERYNLELAASRVSERYGITPIGNNKDPLVNLANGFQKRLDLDQANKVGMFAESGSPVSLNQQGSIPNPLQAFDKLKNKLNGSALDTTVKPATPENVYGVNALEKLGKKLKMNQGGFLRVPGKDTEMMVTHNLSSENLNKARELGGIPQASVGIVDPKKYAIDGYGEITLVGNNKLVDPKTRGTRSYASDIYSPRQPKADYKMPQGMSDSLVKERYKDYFARYGDQRVRYMGGDNIVGNLSSEPAVIANFLDTKGIKHNIKLNNKDALYELRNVLSKNDSLNNEFYESFVPKEAMAMGAKPKLYAGTSNTTGRQKWVDESMENALKIMRKERKTGAEGIFSNYIGGIRATNTKKFNSIQEIVDNKNRLKTTADFEKAKEAIGTHHESLIDELGKYSDSTESNTFTQYDRQATAISDYLKGEKDAFDYGFKNVPPSFIAKLDTFKKQLHDMPTEYFESVSDRAVKLNEFEKALIPDNLSKPQREAIVKSLNEQGIQPRFYKDGQRQQALIDLMEEDNLARQAQNPVGKSQGGYIKLPGKGAPIEKTITPENLTVVKEYSQMLKSMDDGARGGQMVGNYSDGYKRVTEHSKFYSDYFAKNKRAPSNKAYEEEALRQLKNGQADSYAQKTFDDLQDPEFRSLAGEVEKGSLGKQPLGETFDIPQTATVKTDVKPKAKTNFSKDLPEYDTKKVGLLDKAFRSTRSVIERQGKSGKELAGMLQSQRDSKELWAREIEKRLRTVQKLKDKEFSNFVEATQGKENPMNDKVVKAIEDWKSVHPHIRQRGVDAGLEIGDLGDNYYPHFIDYDKIYKDKNTYNQAINHLVNTGQADTKEKAIELLGFARDTSRNREFGSLEASRIVDLPFYDKTKASLASYIQGSTDRITKTETFGKSDENALKLIKKIAVEGGDTEAAKNAYDIAVGARNYNHTASKISSGIRHYTTVTRLGLGALTNVSQSVNTGIVTGHFRTMGAMLKQLDPKTRQFAEDTGVISDAILNDLRRGFGQETFGSSKVGKAVNVITAPGFKQIESFNRRVAATAGKDYALRLAQKGDDKSINILRKKLGVTGEIDGTLSERQQIQAARKIVEKTQFKVDAQDLPGWTASPGGKLVAQFRTFSYSQGKFFSNEILKPASKGNFMPLGRLMAALPVGYGLYETRRMIDGRPEEENKMKRGLSAFQKVGGAGLAMDAYFALNPLNSKYLPSDRRVSMAGSFLGGPSVGTAMNAVGSLSDMVQRKNSPTDQSRLDGKIALGNNGDTYTDATSFARFGMQQIPIVGSPIMNRVLPYKKSSEADAGKSTQTASSSGTAVKDLKEAKAITKSGYGKEWAKLSEDDIKNKAIEGDEQAQQVYDSLKAMEKVYAPKNVPTKGLSQSAEDILNKSKKFTESGKKAWGSKPSDSNDAKTSLKNWMNGKDVPVTNEIAVEWAKYEQKRVKGELSPLEQNEAKTTLLRKAYSSSLNEDERKYYSVADDKLIGAVQKGWVSQESINKALAVDKQLLELGLTTKSGFGKKVWNALGLSMPSVAGASSSTRSTGRRSGGRVAKKSLKVTKSKIPQAFLSTSKLKSRRSSTNGSLRKLLASAKV